MKRHLKERLLLVILAFSWVFIFSGQLVGAEGKVQSQSIEVTDMVGRPVKLDQPAQKVIALVPSDVEIIYELGAGNILVGRGAYADYPAEVKAIASFDALDQLNVEAIIAVKPDLVILDQAQTEEQIQKLEDAGIKVAVTHADSINDVYRAIRLIGELLGCKDAADKLEEKMEQVFDDYSKEAEDQEPTTVYYEVSPEEFGLWTAGKNTFMDEIGQKLKLTNIFGDVEGWQEVSKEEVLKAEPDIIITTSHADPEAGMNPVDEILSRKDGWENVPAIQNQRVYRVDADAFTRPGPRLMEAIEELYELISGQVVEDAA